MIQRSLCSPHHIGMLNWYPIILSSKGFGSKTQCGPHSVLVHIIDVELTHVVNLQVYRRIEFDVYPVRCGFNEMIYKSITSSRFYEPFSQAVHRHIVYILEKYTLLAHEKSLLVQGWGLLSKFLRSVISAFFSIVRTHVGYWISCSYLTGVAVAQLQWQKSNMNVNAINQQAYLLDRKSMRN